MESEDEWGREGATMLHLSPRHPAHVSTRLHPNKAGASPSSQGTGQPSPAHREGTGAASVAVQPAGAHVPHATPGGPSPRSTGSVPVPGSSGNGMGSNAWDPHAVTLLWKSKAQAAEARCRQLEAELVAARAEANSLRLERDAAESALTVSRAVAAGKGPREHGTESKGRPTAMSASAPAPVHRDEESSAADLLQRLKQERKLRMAVEAKLKEAQVGKAGTGLTRVEHQAALQAERHRGQEAVNRVQGELRTARQQHATIVKQLQDRVESLTAEAQQLRSPKVGVDSAAAPAVPHASVRDDRSESLMSMWRAATSELQQVRQQLDHTIRDHKRKDAEAQERQRDLEQRARQAQHDAHEARLQLQAAQHDARAQVADANQRTREARRALESAQAVATEARASSASKRDQRTAQDAISSAACTSCQQWEKHHADWNAERASLMERVSQQDQRLARSQEQHRQLTDAALQRSREQNQATAQGAAKREAELRDRVGALEAELRRRDQTMHELQLRLQRAQAEATRVAKAGQSAPTQGSVVRRLLFGSSGKKDVDEEGERRNKPMLHTDSPLSSPASWPSPTAVTSSWQAEAKARQAAHLEATKRLAATSAELQRASMHNDALRAEVQGVRSEVAEWQARHSKVMQRLTASEAEARERMLAEQRRHQATQEQLKREVSELSSQVEQAQTRCTHVEQRAAAQLEHAQALRTQAETHAEQRCADLEHRLEVASDEAATQQGEIKRLRDRVHELTMERSRLHAGMESPRASSVPASPFAAATSPGSLQTTWASPSFKFTSLTSPGNEARVSQMRRELTDLQRQVEQLRSDARLHTQAMERLRWEKEQVEARAARATEALQALQRQVDDGQGAVRIREQRIREAADRQVTQARQEALATLERQADAEALVKQLQGELQSVQRALRAMEADAQSQAAVLGSSRQQVAQLQTELDEARAHAEAQDSMRREVVEELRQLRSRACPSCAHATAEAKRLHEALMQADQAHGAAMTTLQRDVEARVEQLERRAQERCSEAAARVQALDTLAFEMRAELDAVCSERDALAEDVSRLQQRVQETEAEAARIQGQSVAERDALADQLLSQAATSQAESEVRLEARVRSAQFEAEQARDDAQQARDALAALEQRMSAVTAAHNQAVAARDAEAAQEQHRATLATQSERERADALAMEAEAARRDAEAAQLRARRAAQERDEAVSQAEDARREMQQVRQDAEAECKRAQLRAEALGAKAAIEARRDAEHAMERALVDARTRADAAAGESVAQWQAQARDSVRRVEQAESEATEAVRALAECRADAERRMVQAEETVKGLQREVEVARADCRNLRSRLTRLEEERAQAQHQYLEKEQEVERLRQHSQRVEADVEAMRAKVATLTDQVSQVRREAQTEVARVNHAMDLAVAQRDEQLTAAEMTHKETIGTAEAREAALHRKLASANERCAQFESALHAAQQGLKQGHEEREQLCQQWEALQQRLTQRKAEQERAMRTQQAHEAELQRVMETRVRDVEARLRAAQEAHHIALRDQAVEAKRHLEEAVAQVQSRAQGERKRAAQAEAKRVAQLEQEWQARLHRSQGEVAQLRTHVDALAQRLSAVQEEAEEAARQQGVAMRVAVDEARETVRMEWSKRVHGVRMELGEARANAEQWEAAWKKLRAQPREPGGGLMMGTAVTSVGSSGMLGYGGDVDDCGDEDDDDDDDDIAWASPSSRQQLNSEASLATTFRHRLDSVRAQLQRTLDTHDDDLAMTADVAPLPMEASLDWEPYSGTPLSGASGPFLSTTFDQDIGVADGLHGVGLGVVDDVDSELLLEGDSIDAWRHSSSDVPERQQLRDISDLTRMLEAQEAWEHGVGSQ